VDRGAGGVQYGGVISVFLFSLYGFLLNPQTIKTALQWWGSVLAALAVIAIMASFVIVTKLTRAMRIKQ